MATWPRFQLSLRLFLLLVVILCAGLAWWMAPATQLRARQLAYRELQPRLYSERLVNNLTDRHAEQVAWLAGLQRPFEAIELCLYNATDADCARLAHFPELQSLELVQSHVTDAGMRQLASLSDLETLKIESPGVTDELATLVPNWPNLMTLEVGKTECGDRVIEAALALPDIWHVAGGRTTTDRGLTLLLQSPAIRSIYIESDLITGAPLKLEPEVQQIHELMLPTARLSPDVQRAIGRMTELHTLEISATPLDVSMLAVLAELNGLYRVELNASHWSAGDQARLIQLATESLFLPDDQQLLWGKRAPIDPESHRYENPYSTYQPAWYQPIREPPQYYGPCI